VGIELVAGCDFDGRDVPTSPRVAIINQTMAEKYFGSTNPLGRRYRAREGDILSDPFEIVGIVKDAKYGARRDEIPATAYVAWSQDGSPSLLMNFEVRAESVVPQALIPVVKSAIDEINRSVSLEFTTLADQIDESFKRDRLLGTLSGFFGGLALLLATMGLYGVMSYDIARRRN
jgi:putative ABC transport system permease protein